MKRLTLFALCLVALLPAAATAGPNEGFVVSIDAPTRIENPVVGETISLAVRADSTTELKGVVVRVRFDTSLVRFNGYRLGDATPGAFALPRDPEIVDGSIAEAEGGSTYLGAGVTAVTTGGVLGFFDFEAVAELPDEGSSIWVTYVKVNTSADSEDEDILTFEKDELAITLVRRYANRIFNVEVTRRSDGATLRWESRFAGLADTVRVRATGDSVWQVAASRQAAGFSDGVVAAASALLTAGVAIDTVNSTAMDTTLSAIELGPPYADGFLDSLLTLNRILRSRRHVVRIGQLSADTQYEYQARSTSVTGQASNRLTGLFRTRQAPDVRPAAGTDLDLQATRTTATATWFTNRLSDSRLTIFDTDSVEVARVQLDPEGTLVHSATISDLQPATSYLFEIRSRLVEADTLIAQGLLTEAQVVVVKSGSFTTRAARQPTRLLAPPSRVVSPESAVINVRLNQIALVTVAYGLADERSPDSVGVALYDASTSTGDILNEHSITLSDLIPSSRYRYRVVAVTPDGDSLSTDPRGNQQWSRDLQFTTSAAGDTLPPVIVEGPDVVVRDVLSVVRFTTDVDTRATVFFGTRNGTYGTVDEFEIPDQSPDGSLRLAQDHTVTISGLEAGVAYDYGIVVSATNGQTASFEPNLPAGKRARASKRLKVLQPPGGAGSFTTSNDPDTQFPVILSGPSITSKSHQTAIVEWTTDEPATSDVTFGQDAVGEARTNSGTNRTRHKIVLSNLEAGAPYVFQVESTDAAGNGATTSGEGVFTTEPEIDLTAPQILSGPDVVYKNDETATIRWTTDEDATAQLEFGTDAETLGFIRTLPSTGTVHEITLTNLTASTAYYFQAASRDISNNGPVTSAIDSFTTDATPDQQAPVLSDIEVTALDSSAIVSWVSDELADSFVDYGTVSGILDVTVGDASDVIEHEVTLTNLTPGVEYFLTVGSSDRAGNGPTESEEVSFTTLAQADTVAPPAPAGVTGTASNAAVVLSWGASNAGDLAGYNVYRRTGDAAFAPVATLVTQTSFTDRGLTNDTAYDYQITAVDRARPANESSAADSLTLTPTASAAPTVPTDLRTEGQALKPTFLFGNSDPFITGAVLSYTIQVSTQSDFSDVTSSQSGIVQGIGSTSWQIPRVLEDGRTYYWRVRAVEGLLPGPFSATQEYVASTGPLLLGDFNDSGAVDFDDFFAFVDAFGQSADDFPDFDLNGSGPGSFIDFDDFFAFVDVFGTTAGKIAGQAPQYPQHETAMLQLIVAEDASSATVSQSVELQLRAVDAPATTAFGATVSWDPTLLDLDHARPADGGRADLFQVLDQRPGQLRLGGARPGAGFADGQDWALLSFRLRDRTRINDVRVTLDEALLSADSQILRAGTGVAATVRPSVFALSHAYPNPFNPSTQIDFALPSATPARLHVYDVLGRVVRTLVRDESPRAAGFYSVRWDGRDQSGRAVASGVYFFRLLTPQFTGTGKMLLLE